MGSQEGISTEKALDVKCHSIYTVNMNTATPFFPAWRAFCAPCRRQVAQLQHAGLSELEALFAPVIPTDRLPQTHHGLNSRERIYTVRTTFWAFLSQVLTPGSSCRETVRKIQVLFQQRGGPLVDEDTGAYCTARKRLPSVTLQSIHQHTAQNLEQQVPQEDLWLGRHIKIVDGTTLSMPDTPENQAAYPQPSSQKPGCGFPILRWVALFSLASGALIQAVQGTLRVHESKLLPLLITALHCGEVLLTDRGLCSFTTIADLLDRGIDAVMRLHQRRPADFRKGQRLGANDRLVRWKKPVQRPATINLDQWLALPTELTLRLVRFQISRPGFRTREIILVTTLLDPAIYAAQALAQLYLRRWKIELSFRELKTTLQLEVLRCLTPTMIEKELWMHQIAYNLIRTLMLEAALTYRVPLVRISFKGTVDTLRQWSRLIQSARGKKRDRLIAILLKIIAADQLPDRPNRREPRCVKRRPKPYQYLTKPRHRMREIPHRNKYRKP